MRIPKLLQPSPTTLTSNEPRRRSSMSATPIPLSSAGPSAGSGPRHLLQFLAALTAQLVDLVDLVLGEAGHAPELLGQTDGAVLVLAPAPAQAEKLVDGA